MLGDGGRVALLHTDSSVTCKYLFYAGSNAGQKEGSNEEH